MTTPWSVTPMKKSQRISGPKSMTSRGHRYVSPKPTPRAARSMPGPRMCNEAGGSGNSLIGIGSSLPARHTFSSCTSSVVPPGAPPLDVSTTISFLAPTGQCPMRLQSILTDFDRMVRFTPCRVLARTACVRDRPVPYPEPWKTSVNAEHPNPILLADLSALSLLRQVIPAYTEARFVSSRPLSRAKRPHVFVKPLLRSVVPLPQCGVRSRTYSCDTFLIHWHRLLES